MNAGTEEPTLGAMIAGMLVLGTLGCSLLMIAFWIMRYLQFGYVLPDSGRGYLRVPLAGTVVGIVMATLLAILATVLPLLPSEEFATATQGNPPATPAQPETAQPRQFQLKQLQLKQPLNPLKRQRVPNNRLRRNES